MNPLFSGLLIGMAFGAILFASGLSDPRRILGMLRLQDLHLLKVLVTAIAVGIVGIALLSCFGAAHTSIKTLHVLAVSAGGVLFGIGFAVTGYCPGTSLAAAATGRRDALFVVAGGLTGSALYAVSYAWLKPLLLEPLTYGKPTLFSWLGIPALWVALPLGALAAWSVFLWLRAEHPAPPSTHSRQETWRGRETSDPTRG
jgi:uncharacterized membrane protein YedE/YeeE